MLKSKFGSIQTLPGSLKNVKRSGMTRRSCKESVLMGPRTRVYKYERWVEIKRLRSRKSNRS